MHDAVDKLMKKANSVWQVILGLSRYPVFLNHRTHRAHGNESSPVMSSFRVFGVFRGSRISWIFKASLVASIGLVMLHHPLLVSCEHLRVFGQHYVAFRHAPSQHGRYRTPKQLARNAKNPGKTRVFEHGLQKANGEDRKP